MTPLHRDIVLSIPELTADILTYLGPRSLCSLRLVSRSFHQACIPYFRVAIQYSGPISWNTTTPPSEKKEQSERHDLYQLFPIKGSGHLVRSLSLSNCHPRTLQEEKDLNEWFSYLVGLESFYLQESSRGLDPDTAKTVLPCIQQCSTLKHLRLRLSEITRDEVLEAILLGLGSLTGICARLESLSVEIRRGGRGPGVNLRWEVLMQTLANLPRLNSLSLHGFTVLRPENMMDTEDGDDDDDSVAGPQAAADEEEDEDESEEKELELNCNFPKITQFQSFNCSLPKFNLARLFPNVKSLGVFSLDDRFNTGPLSSDLIPNDQSDSESTGSAMDPSMETPPLNLDRLSFGALTADNMDAVLDALGPDRSGRHRHRSSSSGLYVEARPSLTKIIKPVALSIQLLNRIEFEPFAAALQDRGIEVREFTFTKGISNQASMLVKPCFKNLQDLDVIDLGLQFGTWQLELDQRPVTSAAAAANVQRGSYSEMYSNAFRDGEESMLASMDAAFIHSKMPFAHSLRSLHLGAGDSGNGRFTERERSRYRFMGESRLHGHSQRFSIVVLRRILACLPVLEEFHLGTALDDLSLFEGLGKCSRLERQGLWGEWHGLMAVVVATTSTESLNDKKGDEEETESWLKTERPFLRDLRIFSSAGVTKTHKTRIAAWQTTLEHRFRFLETLQITPDQ